MHFLVDILLKTKEKYQLHDNNYEQEFNCSFSKKTETLFHTKELNVNIVKNQKKKFTKIF